MRLFTRIKLEGRTRARLAWVGAILAVVSLLAAVAFATYRAPPSGRVRQVHGLADAPYENPRVLAGWAAAIFLGQVTSFEGSIQEGGFGLGTDVTPVSLFNVRVSETLKGEPSGVVHTSMPGGYDRLTGDLILFNGDPLLEIGRFYWFATRFNAERGTYYPIARYGKVLVQSPEHKDLMRSLLIDAIEHQIPYGLGLDKPAK